jgi:hypothetical protein
MGKKKDTTEILKDFKEYVGEGGLLAFEHGFHYPQFKLGDCKWIVTCVSDKVAYGYKRYPLTKERRTCNYALCTLNYSTLNKLMYYMKKYETYCKEEA